MADLLFSLDEPGREKHLFCSSPTDFSFLRLLVRIRGRISVFYGLCRPGTSYSAPVIARVLALVRYACLRAANELLPEVFPRQMPRSVGGWAGWSAASSRQDLEVRPILTDPSLAGSNGGSPGENRLAGNRHLPQFWYASLF